MVSLFFFMATVLKPSLFQILDLKKKIEAEKGEKDYPVAAQKLIYAGKIMADGDSLSKYNVDQKKFIVVMVAKVKAAASTAPQPSSESSKAPDEEQKDARKEEGDKKKNSDDNSTASTNKEAKKDEKKDESHKDDGKDSKPTSEESAASKPVASDGNDLVMGEAYNKMVQNIVDMGYEKSQVRLSNSKE